LAYGAGTGELQGYAIALAGLWTGLSRTLTRLEALAADPAQRLADGEAAELLPRLQYVLHSASELALGLEPPAGAESAHAELAAALADARDATAEIVDALDGGGLAAVEPLVLEWRGALFRVRLARMRLAAAPPSAPATAHDETRALPLPRTAAAATAFVLLGVAAFTVGAMVAVWPIWATGLVLVAAGFVVQRTP
jgi:hypothetical protein